VLLATVRIRLSSGTVYTALRRLCERRWIQQLPVTDRSRHKRTYVLTATGRNALAIEINRIRDLARIGVARLNDGDSGVR